MSSFPQTIIHSVNESTKLNRDYSDEVCVDIQRRIESKLAENNMTIAEKAEFAKKNFMVMNKWEQVFPGNISNCLREYFRAKCQWAPQFDPRFPNQNQTKKCFVNFIDLQRCIKMKGANHKDCDFFQQMTTHLCPETWLEKYAEQIQNNSFPVDI